MELDFPQNHSAGRRLLVATSSAQLVFLFEDAVHPFGQYCCHEYVQALKVRAAISMEVDHCAENALAERMNGILKKDSAPIGPGVCHQNQAYAKLAGGARHLALQ